MNTIEALKVRRSYYDINKDINTTKEEISSTIKEVTALVPDAFNMQSARVVVLFDEQHEKLWDSVYDIFNGEVPKDKLDSFKAGYGTVLYFYDEDVVSSLQEQFPLYADNFPVWANQANGMLQLSIWTALRELGLGASLQHYNPVIDIKIKEIFNIPSNYKLLGQMPFGGIVSEPDNKEKLDIETRVTILD